MSTSIKGRLQFDRQRGVIYFHDETGGCSLRIEGIPEVPEGHQIDIHLIQPGGEHHHENCGNRALVLKGATWDRGAVCAVKLMRPAPDHQIAER